LTTLIARLFIAILLALPSAAWADQTGRIVGVIDGDTVDLLTQTEVLIRVRLSGIDAPEKKQPFGNAAKQALSSLAFNKTVLITGEKRDRYGRLIGKIVVAGTDVNLRMVQLGYAWHFKKYEREQPLTDRGLYAQAELAARVQRAGLWLDKDAVAPWEFRSARQSSQPKQVKRE